MATSNKARTNTGIAAHTGVWDNSAILHLLRRVHFGVKKENLEHFKTLTMSQAVDEILNVDYTAPSPPINNYNDILPDANVPAGSTWINDYNGLLNGQRRGSFKMWWAGQIVNQDRTIREKMVAFWHNHFATQTQVVSWANLVYFNNALLRKNCLKNFKTLTKDITLDPAMLIYLNGERNTNTAPDENYSRELQELFTLGKGPNSNYTEDDVIAGARVLTGWRLDKTTGTPYFQANRHDTDDKQFSAFYNNTVISGNVDGEIELDNMLDMIFTQNEVSKHIVRKLYRFFVYYDIDTTTETDVIEPLAAIFRTNGYEIKPVLEALFKSEHFFDVANRGALIKSPIDFTYSICRTFGLEFKDGTEYVDQYRQWYLMAYVTALMQQDLGDPPSVAGWPAYYQIPQYHELWINSDTLPNRNKISDVLVTYGYGSGNYRLTVNAAAFTATLDNPENPTSLINESLELLHTLPVEQSQKDYMKTILLSGQLDDSYWTTAWNDYTNDPSDEAKSNIVNNRLNVLYKYIMNLSEFQLS